MTYFLDEVPEFRVGVVQEPEFISSQCCIGFVRPLQLPLVFDWDIFLQAHVLRSPCRVVLLFLFHPLDKITEFSFNDLLI